MNGFDRVLDQAARRADVHGTPGEGDFMGPDGLLHCGQCKTPKQCRVRIGGRERVVGCLCRCAGERREEEQARLRESQRQLLRNRRRRSAIADSMLRDVSFDDAKPSPLMEKAKNYVKNWEEVLENNVGLLLIGGVGVGKSYAAACICNALLDRGVSCLMTSFGRILSMEWEDRARFLSTLGRYDLLVLDDLGAERNTDFAGETVFSVIDERYRAKKPLIVTTNLELRELKNPEGIRQARVYDRLLEICGPVLCKGESFRQSGGKVTREVLRGVLGGDREDAG